MVWIVFLDFLPKHLTLLRLLLDVDWLLKAWPFLVLTHWLVPSFFVTAYISQRLGSVLWSSMGLEFPKSMMRLGKFPLKGTHLFLRLLKLWLPLSKVPVTSDIVPILAFVQSLHTAGLSLLSSVALFLIVHSSICRVSWVDHFGSPLLEKRDNREITER